MNIIKFADDRINEFSNGGFHAVNDGKPIEVASADVAKDLLEAKHLLDGEYLPVFVLAKVNDPTEQSDSTTDDEVEAETAESLAKAHSRDELLSMAKEAGLDGDSYANKTEIATAILNAKGE